MSKHVLPRTHEDQHTQSRRKRVALAGVAAALTIGALGSVGGGLNASWSNQAAAEADLAASGEITINGVESYDANSDLGLLVPGEPQTVPLQVLHTGPGTGYASVAHDVGGGTPGFADFLQYTVTDDLGTVVLDGTLADLAAQGPVLFPGDISNLGPQDWALTIELDENTPPAHIGSTAPDVDLVLTVQ